MDVNRLKFNSFRRKNKIKQMNFYYDPILGLQYTYLGDYFLIDIAALPQVDDILKQFRQQGVCIGESPIIERILNITQYKL